MRATELDQAAMKDMGTTFGAAAGGEHDLVASGRFGNDDDQVMYREAD